MAVELVATDATFVGTGVSSTYAAPIYANDDDQVQVYVNGGLQTIGDDYVLNGLGSAAGINIVANFPLNANIYVERVTPVKQEVDTKNNETILEDVLDGALDKLTMMVQERAGETSRALLVPRGEAGLSLPALDLRRGFFFGFDAAGQPALLTGTGNDPALRTDLTRGVDLTAFRQLPAATGDLPQSPLYPVNLSVRETTNLDKWYTPGDGDYYLASRKAALDSYFNGCPIKLSRKDYAGSRLEIHGGASVEGNGGNITYLGIGNTLIFGDNISMSPWPTTDTDAMADKFPVTMYSVTEGDIDALRLDTALGIDVGDLLLVAQDLASNSSYSNAIPKKYEYFVVREKSGTVIRAVNRFDHAYVAGAKVFACKGIAKGGSVRDLTITGTGGAYQHVVRSAFNMLIENITFAGDNSVGAGTFQSRVTYKNIDVLGAYNGWSTARCSSQITLEGFNFRPQSRPNTPQPLGIFIEESPDGIYMRDIKLRGAGIALGSIENQNSQGRRPIVFENIHVDTSDSAQPYPPFAMGSVYGPDIYVRGGTLKGRMMDNSPGFSNAGVCLVPLSGNSPGNYVRFSDINFEADVPGRAIGLGGAFGGDLIVDVASSRFINTSPPPTYCRKDKVKGGTVMMGGTTFAVVFADGHAAADNNFMPSPYSITLTSNSATVPWYSDATQNGFTINAAAGSEVKWTAKYTGDL